MSSSLTFRRVDPKGEAPKGWFDAIERHFRERGVEEGNFEIRLGGFRNGTHHRRCVKPQSVRGRAITGVCQTGDNRTCFEFFVTVHRPQEPEKIFQKLTAAATEEKPPLCLIVVEERREPNRVSFAHILGDKANLGSLTSLVKESLDPQGQVRVSDLKAAATLIYEERSDGGRPTDEIIEEGIAILVSEGILEPVPDHQQGVAHYTVAGCKPAPETSVSIAVIGASPAVAGKTLRPASEIEANGSIGSLAPATPIASANAEPPAAQLTTTQVIVGLCEDRATARILMDRLGLKAKKGHVNHNEAVDVIKGLCRERKIDLREVDPSTYGKALGKLTSHGLQAVVPGRAWKHGYNIVAMKTEDEDAPKGESNFFGVFRSADLTEGLMVEMRKSCDKHGVISYQSALNTLVRFGDGRNLNARALSNRQLGQALALLVKGNHLTQLGEPHEHKGYRLTVIAPNAPAVAADSSDARKDEGIVILPNERLRLVRRLKEDPSVFVIGEALIGLVGSRSGHVSPNRLVDAIVEAQDLTNDRSVVEEAVKAYVLDGHLHPEYGVDGITIKGYHLTIKLRDFVARKQEEERRFVPRPEVVAKTTIEEPKADPAVAGSKPTPPVEAQATVRKDLAAHVEPDQVEVDVEVRREVVIVPAAATNEPEPEQVTAAAPAAESTIDHELNEINRQMADLELMKQRLVLSKVVGEHLKDNPEAAEAMKQLLQSGSLEDIKRFLG